MRRLLCMLGLVGVALGGAQALPPAPPGGSVRALAADPAHPGWVILGTTTGVVYRSQDEGQDWDFLARVAPHDDWVVAGLVADAGQRGRWLAGLWSWRGAAGGIYVSDDEGQDWRPLWQGHPVRALAQAASDPLTWVAATLDGVYRSRDGGLHWSLISPAGDRELMNVESVAIDPTDAQVIYVGTWHLPWKTINGGHDWWQMRNGVIDDSDVFSIAVDRRQPATVYLSACSGIYRSDDHGNLFRKIQGIPYSARRTPALVQDRLHPATIYAGTTQGLWATHDSGAQWERLTSDRLRVNAVLLLPAGAGPETILLGTDFAGIYASRDQGASFTPSNHGFANRQVAALAPAKGGIYEAVTGDEAWGGVFWKADGDGEAWRQLPAPRRQGDVLDLHWSPAGLVAATAAGVFWRPAAAAATAPWQPASSGPPDATTGLSSPMPASPLLFAAAASGLYRSEDGGRHWRWLRAAPAPLYQVLSAPGAQGRTWVWVAGPGYVIRSDDGGEHFLAGRLSLDAAAHGRIQQLALLPRPDGTPLLVAATTCGLYQSSDQGASWSRSGHGLPATDIIAVHAQADGLYALSASVGEVYRSDDGGQHWAAVDLPAESETWARSNAALLPDWRQPAGIRAAAPRPKVEPDFPF